MEGLQLVEAGRPSEVSEAMRTLESEPGVLYAEPNRRRTIAAVDPTDPLFNRLWGPAQSGGYLGGIRGVPDATSTHPRHGR